MQDRLENFLSAYVLSRRARTIIRQNLVISLGTVVVLVGLALAGKIPLTLGVVGTKEHRAGGDEQPPVAVRESATCDRGCARSKQRASGLEATVIGSRRPGCESLA